MPDSGKDKMAAALKPFGWTCTNDFWSRYHSDPWVFNLANAVERLTEQLRLATIDQATAEADANDARLFLALERTENIRSVQMNDGSEAGS